jgi:dGTPase
MDNRFFSTERLRPSTSTGERSNKQQFESDRGRILYSAPLRRLQSKAQVFSLEENASVRSRLTHSMEVAHVGRYLSHKISETAEKKGYKLLKQKCLEIETLVETACYLHDIGNPPFGHLGEAAIQDWFSAKAPNLYEKATNKKIDKKSSHYLDFTHFDGNPQAIRIALTLQGLPEKHGFNLTYAQIASLVKYPKFSNEDPHKVGKIAAFTPERNAISKIWKSLEIEWHKRHPLVLLMEAADDISYSLSDIEDGIEKGIVTVEEVLESLKQDFSTLDSKFSNCIELGTESSNDVVTSKFVTFRTKMVNLLVREAADQFVNNIDEICKGNRKELFEEESDHNKALKHIEKYCRKKLYRSNQAEDIEIAGYNIVNGLLDKFSVILELTRVQFINILNDEEDTPPLATRMTGKLPLKLIKHYQLNKDSEDEWFYRLHLIVDHISGMTDDYALRLFRLLNGIDVKTV